MIGLKIHKYMYIAESIFSHCLIQSQYSIEDHSLQRERERERDRERERVRGRRERERERERESSETLDANYKFNFCMISGKDFLVRFCVLLA